MLYGSEGGVLRVLPKRSGKGTESCTVGQNGTKLTCSWNMHTHPDFIAAKSELMSGVDKAKTLYEATQV